MAMKRVLDVWKYHAAKSKGFESSFRSMVLNNATDKKIEMQFTVSDDMTNFGGTLHGGATATIADMVSSLGLVAAEKPPGVSVNLSINYVRAARVGEEVIVDSEIVKLGKTLAFLDIKLSKKKTGEIIATGSHVKHIAS